MGIKKKLFDIFINSSATFSFRYIGMNKIFDYPSLL